MRILKTLRRFTRTRTDIVYTTLTTGRFANSIGSLRAVVFPRLLSPIGRTRTPAAVARHYARFIEEPLSFSLAGCTPRQRDAVIGLELVRAVIEMPRREPNIAKRGYYDPRRQAGPGEGPEASAWIQKCLRHRHAWRIASLSVAIDIECTRRNVSAFVVDTTDLRQVEQKAARVEQYSSQEITAADFKAAVARLRRVVRKTRVAVICRRFLRRSKHSGGPEFDAVDDRLLAVQIATFRQMNGLDPDCVVKRGYSGVLGEALSYLLPPDFYARFFAPPRSSGPSERPVEQGILSTTQNHLKHARRGWSEVEWKEVTPLIERFLKSTRADDGPHENDDPPSCSGAKKAEPPDRSNTEKAGLEALRVVHTAVRFAEALLERGAEDIPGAETAGLEELAAAHEDIAEEGWDPALFWAAFRFGLLAHVNASGTSSATFREVLARVGEPSLADADALRRVGCEGSAYELEQYLRKRSQATRPQQARQGCRGRGLMHQRFLEWTRRMWFPITAAVAASAALMLVLPLNHDALVETGDPHKNVHQPSGSVGHVRSGTTTSEPVTLRVVGLRLSGRTSEEQSVELDRRRPQASVGEFLELSIAITGEAPFVLVYDVYAERERTLTPMLDRRRTVHGTATLRFQVQGPLGEHGLLVAAQASARPLLEDALSRARQTCTSDDERDRPAALLACNVLSLKVVRATDR